MTTRHQAARGTFDVRPDEVDGAGLVLGGPRIEGADLHLDGARVVAGQLSQQFAVDGVAGDGRKRARHGAERTGGSVVFEECKAASVKDARAHVGHERPIWRQADGGGGLKGPAFGVGTAYVRMERVESGDRAR